jgi:hypothetical protein
MPDKEETMQERRKLERFDLELPAKIGFINETHKEKILNLLTSNICSGGAYFQSTQLLPEGTRVKIDLALPLDKLTRLKEEYRQAYIKVTGRVLRSESEGMAICFDEDYEIRGVGI